MGNGVLQDLGWDWGGDEGFGGLEGIGWKTAHGSCDHSSLLLQLFALHNNTHS